MDDDGDVYDGELVPRASGGVTAGAASEPAADSADEKLLAKYHRQASEQESARARGRARRHVQEREADLPAKELLCGDPFAYGRVSH